MGRDAYRGPATPHGLRPNYARRRCHRVVDEKAKRRKVGAVVSRLRLREFYRRWGRRLNIRPEETTVNGMIARLAQEIKEELEKMLRPSETGG